LFVFGDVLEAPILFPVKFEIFFRFYADAHAPTGFPGAVSFFTTLFVQPLSLET
jgi:hypothetical protein